MSDNPLEAEVKLWSDRYVEMVMAMTEFIAPQKPWWFVELSPEEQLWRWAGNGQDVPGMREGIVGWLLDVAPYLPVKNYEELLDHLEDIFTGPIMDLIPGELLVDERMDPLIELVQAAGPKDAAKHIRKMERMVASRSLVEKQIERARQEELGGLDIEAQLQAAAPLALPGPAASPAY